MKSTTSSRKDEFKESLPQVAAKVAVLMGSDSDWAIMKEACDLLDQFSVCYAKRVISAHRNPEDLAEFIKTSDSIDVFIGGAGAAAHLPGVIASLTTKPVIGVPLLGKSLQGQDSLYSIVQMPKGIPVATVAIQGAANAALLAIQMLAIKDLELKQKLLNYREKLKIESRAKSQNLI